MKELPFFKFNVAEWLQGDITLCDFETQGLFINICSYYWSKQGNISYSLLKLRLSQAKAPLFDKLEAMNIIKVNTKNDTIKITFLDEQIENFNFEHKKYSDAGRKGAEAKKTKKQQVTVQTPLKPSLSQASTPLKHKDKEVDKDIEIDKDKDKDKDIKGRKSKKCLFRNSEYFNNIALIEEKIGEKYLKYNILFYYESVLNWSDSKDVTAIDWLATLRGFILRDIKGNNARLKS